MRVLVTGGAGYLGSVLVPRLLDEGHQVDVLDRLIHGLPFVEPRERLAVHQGDIRDADALHSLLRGCEAIIHLAFTSNDPAYRLDRGIAKSINLDALPPLLDMAGGAGVERFFFLSSCSIYGASAAAFINEEAEPLPLTDYARHKWLCESMIAHHPHAPPSRVILRPATLCGRAPRQRFDLLVNRMVAEALCRGFIAVPPGDRHRPVLAIDTLAELIVHLLFLPAESGVRVYNAAFENRTVAEWAEVAVVAAGCGAPERVEGGGRRALLHSRFDAHNPRDRFRADNDCSDRRGRAGSGDPGRRLS